MARDTVSEAPAPSPSKAMSGRLAVLGGTPDFPVAALLRRCGLSVADAEPPPKQISEPLAVRHGFGLASVRAGALGHPRLLRQLVDQAVTDTLPDNAFWPQRDGTLVDGLRAGVDPFGLPDTSAAVAFRKAHLAALRGLLAETSVLVLPLTTLRGMTDPSDGTLFPEPPAHVTVPKTLKLKRTLAKPAELEADFAALLGRLQALAPGLRVWLVVQPAGDDLDHCATEATLRALAAGWQKRFPDVLADPVLDHLLYRMAALPPDDAEAAALGRLAAAPLTGARLGDVASPSAPAAEAPRPTDRTEGRAERKERRRQRRMKRQRGPSAAVICEDELLEAFS